MAKYKIITDSCSDLDAEMRKKYDIDYYPMGLVIDGRDTIADLDWKEFTIEEDLFNRRQGCADEEVNLFFYSL